VRAATTTERAVRRELTVAAQEGQLGRVRDFIVNVCEEAGFSAREVSNTKLAVDEACTNIIRHAYCGNCDDKITLRLTRERDMLAFELRDKAPAVDPAKITTRDLGDCRPGGLGVPFIRALMDEWQLEPGTDGKGNVLRMRKRLHSDGDLEAHK